MGGPIRVLVVDDSAFIRHTIVKHLEKDPAIKVVGKAGDGLEALELTVALKPDVITLDVLMPRLDGLESLRRIMAEWPTPVIMLSSVTRTGARTTIQALMRGAVDFVTKPQTGTRIDEISKELIAKIKAVAGVRVSSGLVPLAPPHLPVKAGPSLFRRGDPVVVIGASTGGPRALEQVLCDLPAQLPAAIVVVQHMPAPFVTALANRLNETAPLTVQEAAEGDRLARGLVLMAPGGYHLHLNGHRKVTLAQGPRRNGVCPAVDFVMESAAKHYGSNVVGVVLTGMGHDGVEGARCIKAAGGRVIAEHRSTSVVYGMPRGVVEAGLADRVVPLPKVAPTLLDLIV